ncbi:hypothetical protein KY285_030601 [Solanum tuberosum]|nr:hypothetical protein KY285_030601 [Solanum tuberosum]
MTRAREVGQEWFVTHERDNMRSPEGSIYPLKKKGPRHVTKKRKFDVQDPVFGTFIEGTDSHSLDSIPPLAKLLLKGPPTLVHLSGHMQFMDTSIHLQIQELTRSLPTGPRKSSSASGSSTSTLSTLVHDNQILKNMMAKMGRRKKKMTEHEKKKSKFLKKMMSTLRKLCVLGDTTKKTDKRYLKVETSKVGH